MIGSVKVLVDPVICEQIFAGVVEAMRFGALEDSEKGALLSLDLLRRLRSDCVVFLYLLDATAIDRPFSRDIQSKAKVSVCAEPRRAGNDLWFTRAGDGCGFWDGDWDEPGEREVGDYLKWLANLIPQVEVYVGDNGYIYGTR